MSPLELSHQFNNSAFHSIWHYALVNISGNEIKISNIILAIITLFIFYKFSKKFTKFIIKIISKNLKEDQDTLYTIEKFISYTLFVITIFISLQIANIPLGVFAFIGGALAIGVGLGAQSVVGNFINSMTIMIEKPIKIGDVIEIQETIGKVKSLGSRCLVLETEDYEETLIPNTVLLQNKFSKWVLVDNKISFDVYINILKAYDIKINHDLVIEQLNLVANDCNFKNYKLCLIKISKREDHFCLSLTCNRNLVKSSKELKNRINLSLLKHLEYNFTTEYSKNL